MDDLVKRARGRADNRRKGTAERESQMLFVVARESRDDAALMGEMADRLEALEAEIKRLRDALEPFTVLGGEDDDDYPDSKRVIVTCGRMTDYTLTLGDLRRAARVGAEP